MVGGCHVLIPKFDVKMAVEALEESHVTSFITVPAILASLLAMIRYFSAYIYSFSYYVKKVIVFTCSGFT